MNGFKMDLRTLLVLCVAGLSVWFLGRFTVIPVSLVPLLPLGICRGDSAT